MFRIWRCSYIKHGINLARMNVEDITDYMPQRQSAAYLFISDNFKLTISITNEQIGILDL